MTYTITGIVIALILAGVVYYLIKRKTDETGPTIGSGPPGRNIDPKG